MGGPGWNGGGHRSDVGLRASAALAAGFPLGAISSIEDVAPRVKKRNQAVELLAILDAIPPGNADQTVARLRRQMQRKRD